MDYNASNLDCQVSDSADDVRVHVPVGKGARARENSMFARDCACVRTSDEWTGSGRLHSARMVVKGGGAVEVGTARSRVRCFRFARISARAGLWVASGRKRGDSVSATSGAQPRAVLSRGLVRRRIAALRYVASGRQRAWMRRRTGCVEAWAFTSSPNVVN